MAALHVCTTCRAGGPGPEAGTPVPGRRLHDAVAALLAAPPGHGPQDGASPGLPHDPPHDPPPHDPTRGPARGPVPGLELREVTCLATCERGCSAVIAAEGKWTVLLGGLRPELAADLLAYADAYAASPTGMVMPSRRPASLRGMVTGRVPADPAAAVPAVAPPAAPTAIAPSAVAPGMAA